MDAGRSLLSPPPPPPPPTPNLSRTHHLRGSRAPVSSVSVPMTHDQISMAVLATTSVVRRFPASFIIQEKPDDYKTHHAIKQENVTQAIIDRWHVESEFLPCEEKEEYEIEHYLKVFECQLQYRPGLSFPLPYSKEQPLLVSFGESIVRATDKVPDSEQAEQGISFPEGPGDVLALAKRAMMASRKAASFAEKSNILATELNESHFLSLDDRVLADDNLIKVRSKKLFKRQSTIRRIPKKPNNAIFEVSSSTGTMRKKIDKSLHSNDPLRLFLWGPETKQLLTVQEEKDLFVQIQELTRLEGIKQRLQVQFDCEPTLPQWAEAAGMSCHVLQSHLHYGKRSREKMTYANFRLVVHVAKQYEGKGLDIQDLLQEGSKGLMKSLGKFKPKVGCRFPTYAYWWIRQSIRKAIFQNSRTIRLPENVYALLKRIKNARRLCIQEGHPPTNEELAKHVGISIEKLESLILTTRHPKSIQDFAWADQGVTVQEITSDPKIETPDQIFSNKMMRQHVRNLLGLLPSRERQIIELRFGVHDNLQKSLAEVGAIFGLSRERVRQLETRAMDKLKGFPGQGLGAYIELLI